MTFDRKYLRNQTVQFDKTFLICSTQKYYRLAKFKRNRVCRLRNKWKICFYFELVYFKAFPRYDFVISSICRHCGSLHSGEISTQSVEPFSRYRLLKIFRGRIEVTLWPEKSRKLDSDYASNFAQMSAKRVLSSGTVSSTSDIQILRKVTKCCRFWVCLSQTVSEI
jgi:hypothetical protein